MPVERAGSEWDTLAWGYVRRFAATMPPHRTGVVRYELGAGDQLADAGARHAYLVGDTGAPPWARDAIVYQIWVDRFVPAHKERDDRYGGTFAGVLERLDYVVALGADTIWLNPIHPSSAYHGYEITDYFATDPALGTLDDFDRLVAEIHRRGLRLVLDYVPSHVSDRHPRFQAARSDAASPYREWFRFEHWPDRYRTFFDVATMPQLNHDEAAVREHLIEAATFWLGRGVDGLRLDYAGGATFEFWAELRAAVRESHPECWLFGEVVDTPDAQLGYDGLFDGCLDFQLAQALRATFGFGDWTAVQLGRFLDDHEAAFPPTFSRPSFLDNHDLDRLLFVAGGDARRLRAAALCQFTLAGPPIVYYGTEVGVSQDASIRDVGDQEARLPMRWAGDQDTELLTFFRDLCALRRTLPDEPRETLVAEGARLEYRRGSVVVAFDLDELSAVARDGGDVLLRT